MSRKRIECVECGSDIDGNIMLPEGYGPMHTQCWVNWIDEHNTERAYNNE